MSHTENDRTLQTMEENAAHRKFRELHSIISKADALELIKLLSALESWAFSTQAKFPDYLVERIELAIDKLTAEVLNGG